MSFRFIHTADLHLDSPLRSLALRDPELADLVGSATRQVLSDIVTLCIDEQVDALLIAGDLYDGDQTSMKTARHLVQEMQRLYNAQIRVFVIRGNHDALSKITRELTLPENVHTYGAKAQAVELPGTVPPIAIHGISFAKPYAPESLLQKFQAPLPDRVNIAMLHTSLAGSPGHDVYAPCKLSELQSSGFQYWALGHIHKRSVYQADDSLVVMSGIPQGRDINESGAKSVSLVTVNDDGAIELQERVISLVQFERVHVECRTGPWRERVEQVYQQLLAIRAQTEVPHLVTRVELSCDEELGWLLQRDKDLFLADVQSKLSDANSIWIEKITVSTELSTIQKNASPLQELKDLIELQVLQSQSYLQQVQLLTESVRVGLPRDARLDVGSDPESQVAFIRDLAHEGSLAVLAKLRPDETKGSD